MANRRIAVIGAGNCGYALAADLTLAGYEVNLYGSKERGNLDPVIKRGGIELIGVARKGFAKVSRVTTDIAEAIVGAKLVMITYQSHEHEALARLCAPYLEDGQTIVLVPGDLGSVVFAKTLKEEGVCKHIKIAETRTAMYGSRRVIGEARVNIDTVFPNYIAAFPAQDTKSVLDEVTEVYPDLLPGKNVLEVALGFTNFIHVPMTILNTGTVEAPGRPFYIYGEAKTPSVLTITRAVEREISAVIKKLGLRNFFLEEDKLLTKQPRPGLDKILGPKDMQHRFITEDCQIGLVLRASLGDMIGVPTPVTKALITLASEINGTDYFTEGRTVERLGISGLSIKELNEFFA